MIRRVAVIIVIRILRSKTAARINRYNRFGVYRSGIGPSEGVFAGAVVVTIYGNFLN